MLVYVPDCGHSIIAIPSALLSKAEEDGDLEMYEVPFPVKYVLEKGWRLYNGSVICEGGYNFAYGLEIPRGYEEY